MLVISRREGERIILQLGDGELVKIMVSAIGTRRNPYARVASIAIDAPRTVKIFREEVIQKCGRQSNQST